MAFQTGTVENSHSLVERIYGFLLENGWSLVATLKNTLDGYHDHVFYSSGEFGDDDIYIRIAAGEADRQPVGDIQHPYADGYTEFINAFAYQYFPSTGTSGADGYNELGRYGPSLYVGERTGSASSGWIYEYNLLKSTSSARWRTACNIGHTPRERTAAWDGKRFIYHNIQSGSSSYYTAKVDLFDGTFDYKADAAWYSNSSNTNVYARADRERIYEQVNDGEVNGNFIKYDIANNTWYTRNTIDPYLGPIPDPPWGNTSGGYYGTMSAGVRRHRNPGNYWMYVMRGASSSGTYGHWSQLNLENELWHGYNPVTFPWGVGDYGAYYAPYSIFVPKEESGYEHDRFYVWRGNTTNYWASCRIGDDGYVLPLPMGDWSVHADTPFDQSAGLHAVCVGKTILCTGTDSQSPAQSLWKWELPENPTSAGSWSRVGSAWTQHSFNVGPLLFHAHDHLCGRARISEHQTNTYWLFLDQHRLVVVVKNADGDYEYLYTGKFQPYANPVNATLLEDIPEQSSVIQVSDPTLFEENKRYMICDTTGQNGTYIASDIIRYEKLVAPSEIFTVINNDGSGTLVVSKLTAPYKAGSKVGEDPMPIMVRASSLERALTFDNVNLVDDDAYSDSAWQWYSLTPTVEDAFANATDIEERSLGTFMYSIVLISEGDTYRGKEVRGQLIDVYSCGTAIASETEVGVGSDIYIAFNITDTGETQRIVVGPK